MIGSLRTGRDDLDCQHNLGCAQDAALPLAALEPRPAHNDEVRATHGAGLRRWHKSQIHVHVREHVEVVRELGLQLTAKTEEASLVPREGAGDSSDVHLTGQEAISARQACSHRRHASAHTRQCAIPISAWWAHSSPHALHAVAHASSTARVTSAS